MRAALWAWTREGMVCRPPLLFFRPVWLVTLASASSVRMARKRAQHAGDVFKRSQCGTDGAEDDGRERPTDGGRD